MIRRSSLTLAAKSQQTQSTEAPRRASAYNTYSAASMAAAFSKPMTNVASTPSQQRQSVSVRQPSSFTQTTMSIADRQSGAHHQSKGTENGVAQSEWIEQFDPRYQCPYYENIVTGITQWEVSVTKATTRSCVF